MSGLSDITANLENSRNCLRRIARHDEQQFSKDSLMNVMERFVKSVNYMDETILVPCRLMDRQVGDATDTIPLPSKTSTSSHYAQLHHHLSGGINCRKDRQITVHEFLNAADLFNLYNMLNSLKNDLLWTRNDVDEGNIDEDNNTTTISSSYGHSTISCSSTSISLNDQDARARCKYNEQQQTSSGDQQKMVIVNSSSNLRTTTESVKGHIRRPSTASMTSSNSVSNLSDSESEISNENDSGIESEGNCGEKGRKCSGNVDKATELARKCRTHLSGLYRCLEQMTEAANYLTARYQSDVGPV